MAVAVVVADRSRRSIVPTRSGSAPVGAGRYLASDHRSITLTSATKRTVVSAGGAHRRGRLVETVVEQVGRRDAMVDRHVDEQFVVEAQHESCARAEPSAPHERGPRLEELGGGALDHRVAAVAPAAAARDLASRSVMSRCRRRPSARAGRRRCAGRAALGGLVGAPEVVHRHRVVRSRPRAPRPRAGGLAVHRAEHGDLGDVARRPEASATGAYMSSSWVARASAASPETAASTRGSIWPRSARTNTWPCSATIAGAVGRHVVQAGGRGHPPGRAVRPGPLPRSRSIGADVFVEPAVAERRGDRARPCATSSSASTIGCGRGALRAAMPVCRAARCRPAAAAT